MRVPPPYQCYEFRPISKLPHQFHATISHHVLKSWKPTDGCTLCMKVTPEEFRRSCYVRKGSDAERVDEDHEPTATDMLVEERASSNLDVLAHAKLINAKLGTRIPAATMPITLVMVFLFLAS
jgi:hypothetical protein